jgi:hypothetical protein
MPSAAPSFLLLRFLCRHKENEVAVGQTRRSCFCLWVLKFYKESNRLRSVALLNTSSQTSQTGSENNFIDILEGFSKMNFKPLFQVIREIFKVLAIIFREDENLQPGAS